MPVGGIVDGYKRNVVGGEGFAPSLAADPGRLTV